MRTWPKVRSGKVPLQACKVVVGNVISISTCPEPAHCRKVGRKEGRYLPCPGHSPRSLALGGSFSTDPTFPSNTVPYCGEPFLVGVCLCFHRSFRFLDAALCPGPIPLHLPPPPFFALSSPLSPFPPPAVLNLKATIPHPSATSSFSTPITTRRGHRL